MIDFKTTKDLVKFILEHHPESRNSDYSLFLLITREIAEREGLDLDTVSVPYFFTNSKKHGFIGFETVRRTRQKLQECYPYLASSEPVKGFRAANEAEYIAFARGDV